MLNIYTRKLTNEGYIIYKDKLDTNTYNIIKKDLTMIPNIKEPFNKNILSFKIYKEYTNYIVLPRYYGISKFGQLDNDNIELKIIDKYDKINIKFNGELRDYQKDIINILLENYYNSSNILKNHAGGIISIPPGKGKTVIAINLITQLKIRTLVIVHKTFLVNQWKERINQYTNATIGIIQRDNIDINNKDIVIGMLQSISLKNYDSELFSAFPLVIYDECHHLGAKVFSKSLMKVNANFYLGLSATPDRKDKLESVFKYFIGDILYKDIINTNSNVIVQMIQYTSDDSINFKTLYNKAIKSYNSAKMITNLCKIESRNILIIKIIKILMQENRKILLLTGRCNSSKSSKSINHIKVITDYLDKDDYLKDKWGLYIGGMKQIQLELSTLKDIIIGTYEMAQEGLDIPSLNTLILATPLKGDISQTCGRILRKNDSYEYSPKIIDIVDMIEPFTFKASIRYSYYLNSKYKCSYYNSDYDILNKAFIKSRITKENIISHKEDNDIFSD